MTKLIVPVVIFPLDETMVILLDVLTGDDDVLLLLFIIFDIPLF